MFGIGFQEMLIILFVVLIFFGPKRLPDLAKSLGKGIAEFKKASDEVRQGINEAIKEEERKEEPPKEVPAAGSPAAGEAVPGADLPVSEAGAAEDLTPAVPPEPRPASESPKEA